MKTTTIKPMMTTSKTVLHLCTINENKESEDNSDNVKKITDL